jgi:hypothetical protein
VELQFQTPPINFVSSNKIYAVQKCDFSELFFDDGGSLTLGTFLAVPWLIRWVDLTVVSIKCPTNFSKII